MNEVFVSEIEVSDGIFKYMHGERREMQHHVPHFNLKVLDFEINREILKNQKFNAEDIIINLKNYAYEAPDNTIDLMFSELDFSSNKGELAITSLFLNLSSAISETDENDSVQHKNYQLQLPLLNVSGINYNEILDQNKLNIEKVLVKNPEINVRDYSSQYSENQKKGIQFFKGLSSQLQELTIENINVQDGNLHYKTLPDEQNEIVHHLKGFDFVIQSIRSNKLDTDSLSLSTISEYIDFHVDEIATEGYEYANLLSPYTFTSSTVSWDAQNQNLQIDSFSLQGDWEKNWQLQAENAAKKEVYNIDARQLNFLNLDLNAALLTSSIALNEVLIKEPHIELLVENNLKLSESKMIASKIAENIAGNNKHVSIDEIKIQDASFKHYSRAPDKRIRKVQELGHASVTLQGVVLDSVFLHRPTKKLPVKNAFLIAHYYEYQTPDYIHKVTLDRVNYNTIEQELTAKSINIDYDSLKVLSGNHEKLRNLYDVYATSFVIKKLDLITAINSGRLNVNQISLFNPSLNVLLNRNLDESSDGNGPDILDDLFSFLNPIIVDEVNLEGGTFIFRELRDEVVRTHLLKHASASVLNLRLNPHQVSTIKEELPFHEIIIIAEDYVYRSPDKIYNILLDSLHYSSRSQELTANFIKIQSDKAENNRLKEEEFEAANRNLFDISADKFKVEGIDLVHAYQTGDYVMQELLIEEPVLSIFQDKDVPVKQDVYEKIDNSKVIKQMADVVQTFYIENLHIKNGTLLLKTVQNSLHEIPTIDHISFSIDKLRLASLTTNDPMEMFEVEELKVLIQDFEYTLPDSLYSIKFGEVSSSYNGKTLQINNLKYKPLFEINEYFDVYDYAKDRYDIDVSQIELQNINLAALYNDQEFRLGKFIINEASVDIFRDDRLDINPDRSPPTLQELLRKSPYYIKADTVIIKNSNVGFSSIPSNGNDPALLHFNDIKLQATNVTNDSALIENNKITEIRAGAQFMGESLLNLNMDLYLNHPEDLYTYEGSLESMDFTELNPILENLIPLRAEDGTIERVNFAVSATKNSAAGEMKFYYRNLELQLIDRESPDKRPGIWLHTGSWLVNSFMVKSRNPTRRGRFRNGDIEATRDRQRSIFKHIGDAMLDGVSSSLMTPFVEKVVYMFVGD